MDLKDCKSSEDCDGGKICHYNVETKSQKCMTIRQIARKLSRQANRKSSSFKKRTPQKKKSPPLYGITAFTDYSGKIQQGQKGFNKYILYEFVKYKLFNNMSINCENIKIGKLMAYQYSVQQIVKPSSVIKRLLCVHRTGAGKTFTIIACLSNFYSDPRPKIIMFPTQTIVQNFYNEIMKFPNVYRDYILEREPELIEELNSTDLTVSRQARIKIANILAMKRELSHVGKPGYLFAPIRAYKYTVSPSKRDPIYKLSFDKNPYNNKIIIMDEVHNIIVPSAENKKYVNKLNRLNKRLKECENSIVLGFTATPFVNDISEGKDLMNMIRGTNTNPTNEGFVSYFNSLPTTIYPVIKEQVYGMVDLGEENAEFYEKISKEKPLVLDQGQNIIEYVNPYKKNKNKPKPKPKPKKGNTSIKKKAPPKRSLDLDKNIQYLMDAANLSAHYTQVWREKFISNMKKNPQGYASKLFRVVNDVIKTGRKSLILIHRRHGFKALVEMYKIVLGKKFYGESCKSKCWLSLYDKDASGAALVAQFNNPDNLRGEKIMTLVVDAQNYSEGVSFYAVRDIYLLNPPESYGMYEQRVGRILRACVYYPLPKSERNVRIVIYVSRGTVDEYLIFNLEKAKEKYDKEMEKEFKNVALDNDFYNKNFVEGIKKMEVLSDEALRKQLWASKKYPQAATQLKSGKYLQPPSLIKSLHY